MSRTAQLACVVMVALATYLLARFAGDRIVFTDRYPAVQKYRTVDEVVEVMGCPPGSYAKTDVAYIGPLDISGNVWARREILTWSGDDCMIVVRKRSDSTVVHTWRVEPVLTPGVFELLVR